MQVKAGTKEKKSDDLKEPVAVNEEAEEQFDEVEI